MAERIVAQQKTVLAELRRDGHSVRMAQRILKAYEDLLAIHIMDRDRLKNDLANDTSRKAGLSGQPTGSKRGSLGR